MEYQSLKLFLLDDVARFRLAVAQYDFPATRDALIERLRSELATAPLAISILDFNRARDARPLLSLLSEQFQQPLSPGASHRAVFVVGVESAVDYGSLPRPHERPHERRTLFEDANLHRDAFPKHCPGPVVLWLSRLAASHFGLAAPDLWHWRSTTFYFVSPSERQAAARDELVEMPLVRSDSLPTRDKLSRLAMLRELLQQARSAPDAESPRALSAQANLLNEIGLAYSAMGNAHEAAEAHTRQLELARRVGDRRGEAAALGNLGLAYAALGEPRRAIEFYEQDLTIAREIGDRRGEGNALGNLGIVYAALGEPRRAIEFHEQHLTIAREIGDRRGEGNALGSLGLAYAALGEPRRAIEFYEQHLAIAREIGDRRGEGNALGNLGNAYAALGEPRRAIEFHEQHLTIAREIGDRRGEATSSWNLGLCYEAAGDLPRAADLMQVCVDYDRELGHPDTEKHAARVAEIRRRMSSTPDPT